VNEIDDYLENIDLDAFKKILDYNLNVSDEKVLILGDEGDGDRLIAPIISTAFKRAADDLGLNAEMVLQTVKLKGENADEAIVESLDNLPRGSVIVLNMSQKIGRLKTLSFRKFCRKHNHRFTSASSLAAIPTEKVDDLLAAYDVDYEQLSERAHELKQIFDDATELRVTTDLGTDIRYNVEGMEAKVSDGIYREPGTGGNLPGTECYIPPNKKKVNGTIVIDGSMRTREGTTLVTTPIEMTIKEGVIVAMNDCDESEHLEETLRWAHNKAKYPWGVRRIGEFGIGLNPNASIVGCTVIDEKAAGTGHFAIGSNHWFGGSIYAIIHLDQVFNDPTVYADGEKIDL
jgi:leucyl aminopeptidase (aminopeptidase T)